MPAYQIHRLKEAQRQQFRMAPHTSGASVAKLKDYELGEVVEAASPYAAWEALRNTPAPLQVGDILEVPGGPLQIFKYVGFEQTTWFVPEPQLSPETADSR